MNMKLLLASKNTGKLEEKNRISHRGVAMQKIKPFIIKHVAHVGH